MTRIVRINQAVTLTKSSSDALQYPISGTLDLAEVDQTGRIVWATFRIDGAAPVVVRKLETLEKVNLPVQHY